MRESIYILKRKALALENTLALMLLRIFPIKKYKISVTTFEGKGGFGCNPKYIVQELHRRNPKYEFVWIVNDMTKEFPDYIKKVPNTFWSRNYHLATSHIWIDNYRKPYGTIKRKSQYYFQTWHAGIGFKKIGLCRGKAFSKMAYLVSKNDSDMIDCTMVDSEWCRAVYPKGLLYDRKMIHTGAPRCDAMFGDKSAIRHELRKKYNLKDDTKILLYAPTYRETDTNGKRGVYLERWSIDFERVLENLQTKFGGEWVLFVRLHPQLAAEAHEYNAGALQNRIIDVSKDDDMYEILPGVDVLITDYSSTIFEASLGNIPAFMYADDLKKFAEGRGGLNFLFHDNSYETVYNDGSVSPGVKAVFPYNISQNNEELQRNIMSFNQGDYEKKIRIFEKDMGIITDGRASMFCADDIEINI